LVHGATLHQLRHSALIHDAEDGASTPMLMAKERAHLGSVVGAVRAAVRRGSGTLAGEERSGEAALTASAGAVAFTERI
jgi:hypothetical protein